MGEVFYFGRHEGHLLARADEIAKLHDPGAGHVNLTNPSPSTETPTVKKGYYYAPRQPEEGLETVLANKILEDVEAEGGLQEEV